MCSIGASLVAQLVKNLPAMQEKIDAGSILGLGRSIEEEILGFPCGSAGKESTCNAGDLGSIPGLRRSPGEENSYPLTYSCLKSSMDRGAWQATVHGIAKSHT